MNINDNLVEYNVQNFQQICGDTSSRTKLINEYRQLIGKRLKIDIEYANRIQQFINLPEMKKTFVNPIKSSQIFFNYLVSNFKSQGNNILNYKQRLTSELSPLIDTKLLELQAEGKKNLGYGVMLEKQFVGEYENIEKLKTRYERKCKQIRKLKQEYIVGFLNDNMPLYNKNKLYIKIKEYEEKQYLPIHKQFTQNVHLFNEYAQIFTERMNRIIERQSQIEGQRIQALKNIFMVLQISKSEYGANMVSQNNAVMMKMNECENDYPDFKKYLPQSYRQSITQKIIEKIDPNKYVNTLFNHIDSKLTENLIMFGTSEKQKKSLQSSLIGEEIEKDLQDNDQEISKQDEFWLKDTQNIEEIGECFKNIFKEEQEVDPEKIKQLQGLMEGDFKARKSFILCFQKFRWAGKFQIPQNKINYIVIIMKIFLDQCLEEKDTFNSKMLMILSLTYHVKTQNQKIDLYVYIRDHKIWADKDWWECALLESIYEHSKVKKKIENQNNQVTLWHIKGSYSKQLQVQDEATFHHVVFNQMLYYITNMNLFGLQKNKVVYVIKKYIAYFNLNQEMVADIQVCLNTERSEQSYIEISGSEKKVDSPQKKCNGHVANNFKEFFH